MKLYCDKCFAKSEYKFSKPKFCPECGGKVSGVIESASVSSTNSTKYSKNKLVDMRHDADSSLDVRSKIYSDDIYEDLDEEEYDYVETQKHINNFKKMKNKSGVTVENDNLNNGVSFGKLIESSSNSSGGDMDFKMVDDKISSIKKTKQQILDEIKSEASSKLRVINID